jgi:hypothetical protein
MVEARHVHLTWDKILDEWDHCLEKGLISKRTITWERFVRMQHVLSIFLRHVYLHSSGLHVKKDQASLARTETLIQRSAADLTEGNQDVTKFTPLATLQATIMYISRIVSPFTGENEKGRQNKLILDTISKFPGSKSKKSFSHLPQGLKLSVCQVMTQRLRDIDHTSEEYENLVESIFNCWPEDDIICACESTDVDPYVLSYWHMITSNLSNLWYQ